VQALLQDLADPLDASWRAAFAHVVPLATHGDGERLLLLGDRAPASADLRWFTHVLGRTLEQLEAAEAQARAGHDRLNLYERLKEASSALERKVQAATADIAKQNEQLRRQALELEQASELKSRFVANMSHEFRTPLNAMLGYTSMLLQGVSGPLAPPVRRQLSRIESNGRHLLAIINDILDISRIEAGQMPLQTTTFALADLVHEVIAELDLLIRRSGLTVTLDLPRRPTPISTDRDKVKQILVNLMSNALKFTRAGGVTIAVRHSPRNRTIQVKVTDTGIGIAAADHKTIFEDFRQLDNSPTRPHGGTGLGLSICRRLARMLNARVTVQSEPGCGATFTLTLPLQGRT
jgi:signal transduction histidine kinase